MNEGKSGSASGICGQSEGRYAGELRAGAEAATGPAIRGGRFLVRQAAAYEPARHEKTRPLIRRPTPGATSETLTIWRSPRPDGRYRVDNSPKTSGRELWRGKAFFEEGKKARRRRRHIPAGAFSVKESVIWRRLNPGGFTRMPVFRCRSVRARYGS